MTHHLKIWPQYFEPVQARKKTFEVRRNDRGFQADDVVVLQEWDPKDPTNGGYTGQEQTFKIGYVLPINGDHVVFSLLDKDG